MKDSRRDQVVADLLASDALTPQASPSDDIFTIHEDDLPYLVEVIARSMSEQAERLEDGDLHRLRAIEPSGANADRAWCSCGWLSSYYLRGSAGTDRAFARHLAEVRDV